TCSSRPEPGSLSLGARRNEPLEAGQYGLGLPAADQAWLADEVEAACFPGWDVRRANPGHGQIAVGSGAQANQAVDFVGSQARDVGSRYDVTDIGLQERVGQR